MLVFCLEDMEILKIFIECIIWERKKWLLECVRDGWLLQYVLGVAHLPISYRTQFNLLNMVPSVPHNLAFVFLISFPASRYLVSHVSQHAPGSFCAAPYTSLPYHATCSPSPLPSFHPIFFSLLLPPPIPLPLSGHSCTLLPERLLLTLPVCRVLVSFSIQFKFHFLRNSMPASLLR